MLLITDYLILPDSSGMIHCTNIVIPCSGDLIGSRSMLIRSMKIDLFVRGLLGSLKPGVSINVILPLLAILTKEVTDVNDAGVSNFRGMALMSIFLL